MANDTIFPRPEILDPADDSAWLTERQAEILRLRAEMPGEELADLLTDLAHTHRTLAAARAKVDKLTHVGEWPIRFTINDEKDAVQSYDTWEEAVAAWEAARDCEPDPREWQNKGWYISGPRAPVIATFVDIRDLFARPTGTDECPVCCQSGAHTHGADEIAEYRKHDRGATRRRDARRNEILDRVRRLVAREDT